jgi:hypothetical protein
MQGSVQRPRADREGKTDPCAVPRPRLISCITTHRI